MEGSLLSSLREINDKICHILPVSMHTVGDASSCTRLVWRDSRFRQKRGAIRGRGWPNPRVATPSNRLRHDVHPYGTACITICGGRPRSSSQGRNPSGTKAGINAPARGFLYPRHFVQFKLPNSIFASKVVQPSAEGKPIVPAILPARNASLALPQRPPCRSQVRRR